MAVCVAVSLTCICAAWNALLVWLQVRDCHRSSQETWEVEMKQQSCPHLAGGVRVGTAAAHTQLLWVCRFVFPPAASPALPDLHGGSQFLPTSHNLAPGLCCSLVKRTSSSAGHLHNQSCRLGRGKRQSGVPVWSHEFQFILVDSRLLLLSSIA